MRSSIVSEVQALKLKVGHLAEVAFGEDQELQFDGNHSTKKSKSSAVVVPGDTDPRSFVDYGDAKMGVIFVMTIRDRRLVFWLRSLFHFGGLSSEGYVRVAVRIACLMITMREMILVVS